MNELQVRLTGDITALQSALTKAKNTIKSFEDSTNRESEKGNVGFKRKIGLIEQLTNKSKSLRTALSQATNEKDVERYNSELEQTIKEMTRLNALGRQVSGSIGSTSNSFKGVTQNIGSANGVAQEFSRIIQDAPFGIIGIGNNLQQLTANFAQTSRAAGGAGAAIKASLSALVTPANLLVLGISAITAAFTAYQLGAFDGLLATKDFTEGLEEFKDTLNAVDSARIETLKSADQEIIKLNSLRSIIEDETVSREKRLDAVQKLRSEFPSIAKNLTDEAFLAGQVASAYEELTKQLIAKAEVESSVKRIVDLNEQERLILEQNKSNLEEINSVRNRIAEFQSKANKAELDFTNAKNASEKDLALRRKLNAENQIRFLRGENDAVNALLKIDEDRAKLTEIANNALKETLVNTEEVSSANETLNEQITTQAEKLGLISSITSQISQLNKDKTLATTQGEINLIQGKIDLLNEELRLINTIAKRANTPIDSGIQPLGSRTLDLEIRTPENLPGISIPSEYLEKLKIDSTEIVDNNKAILDSFSALGIGIASSLDISNNSLKGFVTTLLSSAPKIIQAVIAQAQASKQAAAIANQANAKQASGNAIVSATEAAKGLGPVGLALLPVFIAGGLALISSAFSGLGGGGGSSSGGGGGGAGLAPQIFTNQNSVSPPSGNSPNFNSGSIDFANQQSRLFVDVSGDKLRFILDRENERRGNG